MRARFLSFSAAVLFLSLEAGAEFVWVDADGRALQPLQPFLLSPFLGSQTYVDDAGLFWTLDPETATVSVPHALSSPWFFAEPGCTGPAYELPFPPRQIFSTPNCTVPRYRPDDVRRQRITVVWRMDNGIDCAPYQSVARVVPYSQMIFVDRPAPELGVRAPLHLENRPARE
jgi:hypothetical protein